jgi:hypothetical protein
VRLTQACPVAHGARLGRGAGVGASLLAAGAISLLSKIGHSLRRQGHDVDRLLMLALALAGALVVAAARPLPHAQNTIAVSAAVLIFVFRLVALRRGWHAPRAGHRDP